MADSDSAPSPPAKAPLSPSPKKDGLRPIGEKITELNESQSELLTRLQGLKNELQNWRTKVDVQVKTYKDELSELKKGLEVEVNQLTLDFQELKTTLQKQQEEVVASLKDLGLQGTSEVSGGSELKDGKDDPEIQTSSSDGTEEMHPPAESSVD